MTLEMRKCNGSREILARDGLQLGQVSVWEVQVWRSASLGMYQLGNINLSNFLVTIFILNSYFNRLFDFN